MQNSFLKPGSAFQIGLLGGLGVLLAIAVGAAVTSAATILTWVAAALFVAVGLDPIVRWLGSKRVPRPAAIAIVALGFLGTAGLLFSNIIPTVIREADRLIRQAPTITENLISIEAFNAFDAQIGGILSNSLTSIANFLSDSSNWPTLLGGVVQVSLGIVNGIFGIFVIIILTLYFMASLNPMKEFSYRLVAASKRERFASITEQVVGSVGKWVIAQVSVAFVQSVVVFIFLTILDVPFALLLGSITFLLTLIPLIGSLTAASIVILVSLIQSPLTALVLVLFYLIYLQLEAYVISPRAMKRAVSVPAPLVVIAALLGGTLLGVLGALVAIPTAASVIIVLREVWLPRQQMR